MKLKLIKDDEVVVSKEEYELYYNVRLSVLTQTATFQVLEYSDYVDVTLYCGRGFMPIKRFASDDPEYNKVCAEELCELLNQEQ